MAASIDDNELSEEFEMFGVEVEDENIFDKLKELCMLFSKDAGDIVGEWIAFTSTCKITVSDLTQDNLNKLERWMQNKAPSQSTPKTPKTKKIAYDLENTDSIDVLDAYSSILDQGSKRQHTPENISSKRRVDSTRDAITVDDLDLSSSLITDKSDLYSSRSAAGEVVVNFNSSGKKVEKNKNIEIKVLPGYITESYQYMFEKNHDKVEVLDHCIEEFADTMKDILHIDAFGDANLSSQEEVTVVGRIACESLGKLNATSVVLEGSHMNSGGKPTHLDLSMLSQYAVFPGQIVALTGVNSSGEKFVVKSLHELPIPPCPKLESKSGPFSILVACGPYSTLDGSDDPLHDLIQEIKEADISVLIGPFVDENNESVCNLTDKSFDDLFNELINKIVQETKTAGTQLVFVPSNRDVHHSFIYPQPPYKTTSIMDSRVHFVSDPCSITINNVIISLTSTDSLFNLGQHELSAGLAGRIPRLISHLLKQRNFYPLYPPGEDVNMDLERWRKYAKLPVVDTDTMTEEVQAVTPNILVLPSRLASFVKDVAGSCCINPGLLVKGNSGGTFSRIVVRPDENGVVCSKNVSVKVVKI